MDSIECTEWCQTRAISVVSDGLLSVGQPDQPFSIEISLPAYTRDRLSLAYTLLAPMEEEHAEALLWFRRWNIWSDSSEQYAMRIWQYLRAAKGEQRSFEEAPGHIFAEQDFIDMQSFFSIPLLFRWDAYLIPGHGRHLIFLSHDEIVYVLAKTAPIHGQLLVYLKHWKPQTESPFYLRGIRR